jgi:hypothetical protein
MKTRRYTGKPKNLRQGVCGFFAFLSFLGTYGAVACLGHGYIAYKTGLYLIMGGVILFICFVWGAGALSDGWGDEGDT